MIGGAHEGAAFDVLDAFSLAYLFVPAEGVGMDEGFDGQVHLRGLEILADGHHVEAGLGEA